MQDFSGRLFAGVMLIMALVLVPTFLFALRMDHVKQGLLEEVVIEFVDDARGSGKITKDAYMTFASRVGQYIGTSEIQIVHSTNLQGYSSGIATYDMAYNINDIFEVLDSPTNPRPYSMRDGDYIKVVVRNTSPSLATRLLRIIVPAASATSNYYSYAGVVGNYPEVR